MRRTTAGGAVILRIAADMLVTLAFPRGKIKLIDLANPVPENRP